MSIFYLPDLGEGLADAEIIGWHVKVGDDIALGQLLVSVETAKAVVDIPAPQAGRVQALLARVGEQVPTGAALLEFADAGSPPAPGTSTAAAAPGSREDGGSVVGVLPTQEQQLAAQFMIGRHRHTEARLQQRREKLLPRQRLQQHSERSPTEAAETTEALQGTRRHMAAAMSRAHQEVALVTLNDEAELHWDEDEKPLLRLTQALLHACQVEPALNAGFSAQGRQLHEAVHLGLAVDTAHGLLVPVLRDAHALKSKALKQALKTLVASAHARTLSPADMQGATITLSNFGSLGGRFATPLVLPPQVAIVGAGQIHDGVRLNKKHKAKATRLLPLSLSFDHRAVTGGEAARFLAALKRHLES